MPLIFKRPKKPILQYSCKITYNFDPFHYLEVLSIINGGFSRLHIKHAPKFNKIANYF